MPLVDRVGQELLPIDVALVLVLVLVLLALARLILVILVLVQLVLVILVLILLVILLAPRHPPAYRAPVEAFPRRLPVPSQLAKDKLSPCTSWSKTTVMISALPISSGQRRR